MRIGRFILRHAAAAVFFLGGWAAQGAAFTTSPNVLVGSVEETPDTFAITWTGALEFAPGTVWSLALEHWNIALTLTQPNSYVNPRGWSFHDLELAITGSFGTSLVQYDCPFSPTRPLGTEGQHFDHLPDGKVFRLTQATLMDGDRITLTLEGIHAESIPESAGPWTGLVLLAGGAWLARRRLGPGGVLQGR